jgi:hypothetical protein
LSPIGELARLWVKTHVDVAAYMARHVVPRRRELGRTRAVRGTRRDRSVFVFAAGPSMRKLDPGKIARLQREQGFDLIAINFYPGTEFGRIARPDHYVCSDPAQWTGAIADAEVAHLPPDQREAAQAKFRRSIEGTRAALDELRPQMFLPLDRFDPASQPDAIPFVDATNVFTGNVTDLTRPLGYRPWTAYKALSIACWLGYRRIYLAGIDNDALKSLTVDVDNVKRSRYSHFYDAEGEAEVLVSNEPLSRSLWLESMTFGTLERFRGQPIVNLDPTSLIDCFEKRHELDVYQG